MKLNSDGLVVACDKSSTELIDGKMITQTEKYIFRYENENIAYSEANGMKIDYKYDNRNSILLHCNSPKWFIFDEIEMVSANNLIEKSWDGAKIEYCYQYDDKGFPVECITKQMDGRQSISTFKYIHKLPDEEHEVEPDYDFRDRFFTRQNHRELLKEGKHHLIELGNIAEYDLAGRVRLGYLAELRGDYETAKNCYNSINFTERNTILREKASSENKKFAGLKAVEDCNFRPGSGNPWEEAKFFTRDEILNSQTNTFKTGFYSFTLSEKTPTSLTGEVVFDDNRGLRINAGEFEINMENPLHRTGYMNVAYDTHLQLTLKLTTEDDAEYRLWLCETCKEKQAAQTIEERMAPYAEKIEQLKHEVSKGKNVFDFDDFLGFNVNDHTEFVAAMAFFEEYGLIDFCLKHDFARLNARVRPQFSWWEPTPLYFITIRNAREKMKDPFKMLRFLHTHGANPNISAGDGSTPLWNATNPDCPLELLQTLLEIGANPNQTSRDGDYEWTPLISCLSPIFEENEKNEKNWKPFDTTAIEKAKLLLKHGADPNLATPVFSDYPPLVFAITYGVAQGQTIVETGHAASLQELIELLLKAGADPNFTDSNGKTPLSMAVEKGLSEVEQLLLQHGAKMPEKKEKKPCFEICCDVCATLNFFEKPCDTRRLFPYEKGATPYICEHCKSALT
jgi:hypothetical protein